MNIIIDLLLVGFIMVNLIDISGFVHEMERSLSKWLRIKAVIPKPFSCSYCMTWWVGLVYLFIHGEVTLVNITVLLLVCFFTTTMAEIMWTVKDWMTKIINKIR